MSVTATGTTRVEPLTRLLESDPSAILYGLATATGDVSGGSIQVSWTLPADFLYRFDHIGFQIGVGTTNTGYVVLNPSFQVGGTDFRFIQAVAMPNLGAFLGSGAAVPEIHQIFRPEGSLTVQMGFTTNTNGHDYTARWSSFLWPKDTMSKTPFSAFFPLLG